MYMYIEVIERSLCKPFWKLYNNSRTCYTRLYTRNWWNT